jgi:hypothetical protein
MNGADLGPLRAAGVVGVVRPGTVAAPGGALTRARAVHS